MTVSIRVSVNGNYKLPVKIKTNDNQETTEVISGRGLDGPFVKDITYTPGGIVVVSVGPEEPDPEPAKE